MHPHFLGGGGVQYNPTMYFKRNLIFRKYKNNFTQDMQYELSDVMITCER